MKLESKETCKCVLILKKHLTTNYMGINMNGLNVFSFYHCRVRIEITQLIYKYMSSIVSLILVLFTRTRSRNVSVPLPPTQIPPTSTCEPQLHKLPSPHKEATVY